MPEMFLDLLSRNPVLTAAMAIGVIAWLVIAIRGNAPLTPVHPFEIDAEDDDGLGHYTLEDLRKDYDPDAKWNRPPANHDRL